MAFLSFLKENCMQSTRKALIGVMATLLCLCLAMPVSAITIDQLKYSCNSGTTNVTYNYINSTITGGNGTAGTIEINYTFTEPAGTPAWVMNIGTATAAILNFGIPKGDQGINGTPGATGPQGVNGTPGAQGPQGIQGLQGINGTAATVDVNHTFTLQPGNNANVTNIGNLTAASLDFYIPQGQMNQTPNMSSFFVASTWYDHNIASSDIPGYLVFNRSYPTEIEGTASAAAPVAGTEYLIKAFATEPGDPGLYALPAGERIWHTYASVSSLSGGNSYIVVRLYKRNLAGVETEMYNLTTGALSTSIAEDVTTLTTATDIPMNITDRFVAKYYAKTVSASNPTITLYFDDAIHASKATSPISQGIQGPQGPQGPSGTIIINSTFTGAPGTNANVTNIGNSTNAVLDFTIPGASSATVNMSQIYPVGSVYISTTSTNPAVLFGVGTWVRIGEGRVLIGQDSNITYLNTSLTTGGNFTQNISAHVYG